MTISSDGVRTVTRSIGRVIVAASLLVPVVAWELSQPDESYQHLSDRGRELFDTSPYANGNGMNDDANTYNRLTQSQRSTFEAVAHALERLGIDDSVERVDALWGVSPANEEGRDQYRVSLTLAHGAAQRLRRDSKFRLWGMGCHVKIRNGHIIDGLRNTDCVRQRKPNGSQQASMQISWSQQDLRTAEIDIDYRDWKEEGHNLPSNSDVRSNTFNQVAHYDRHTWTYGKGLVNWWRPR